MPEKLLRFGMHDFLNARPLLGPLRERGESAGLDLVIDAPAALAEKLKSGELDLAMVPAVEYLREADTYRLVPDVCIASRGEVGTVLLISKVPVKKIRSLAVDNRSRTSIALLKVLFTFPVTLEVHPSDPDPDTMLKDHEAALIIGDRALEYKTAPGLVVYDLSAEWFRQTGKTFVHAVVAVRPEINLDKSILEFFREAKREGLAGIDSVVEAYVKESGADPELCADYLKRKIIYDLGDEEMDGLTHFRDLCHEKGIIPEKHSIVFL